MDEINWKSRWSSEQIKAMLIEQSDSFWQHETGIQREKLTEIIQAIPVPHAVIISGLRRVGKSTLLAQLAHHLGRETFYYVNFEDDRFLGFQANDASDLFQFLVRIFGERKIFIMDEIQNVSGWEHFVRRFMDLGYKFFITGSNASLLSLELGTRLTGRYVSYELFPFSFREFLQFQKYPLPDLERMKTVEKAKLNAALETYILSGGIPDALNYPKLPLLQTLFNDVLYRDIAARYRLEAIQVLKELAFLLMSNPSGLISYNKLKEQYRLGSVNTIRNYIEYMENSWLIFTTRVYDYSIKRQQIAPKKIYSIDTGLANTIGFRFSPNNGKLLENLVFISLRRETKEIYYYNTPGGFEVDFYLPQEHQLIQVAQNLTKQSTREREIRALEDAAKGLGVKKLLILASENEDGESVGEIPVKIQSITSWLLRN